MNPCGVGNRADTPVERLPSRLASENNDELRNVCLETGKNRRNNISATSEDVYIPDLWATRVFKHRWKYMLGYGIFGANTAGLAGNAGTEISRKKWIAI